MRAEDIKVILDIAREWTGLTEPIRVKHRPRLLSDNGSAFISHELAAYLDQYNVQHIRGSVRHPQTQGKFERLHRSLKNDVRLENYYFPWEIKQAIDAFIHTYNYERYHESLDNLTPADVYFGRAEEVKSRREEIKQ